MRSWTGYFAGRRNMAVQIEANPRVQTTDAAAMEDLVDLARLQLQIIDSVAQRERPTPPPAPPRESDRNDGATSRQGLRQPRANTVASNS